MPKPIIGITMGDAAGIGPEIVVKAHVSSLAGFCTPVVIGDARVLEATAASLQLPVEIRTIRLPEDALAADRIVNVIDLQNIPPSSFRLGEVSPVCGHAAVEYIRVATHFALEGQLSAIASAPTNKEAINRAGHAFPGQTEIFAHYTGTRSFHIMLIGGPLRVSLVSAHCSLREAIKCCTADRVERIVREQHAALTGVFRLRSPTVAVAGLNPHAGENGLLGSEENECIEPAVNHCKQDGIHVVGPLPADSLFESAEKGAYAGVVAMYHDQGTIPLKRHGYVTYAAGLPIIRTTCGHGTAFDIAGKGIARPDIFIRAVRLAADLAAAVAGAGA